LFLESNSRLVNLSQGFAKGEKNEKGSQWFKYLGISQFGIGSLRAASYATCGCN
jgi:hypothetical protein